MKDAKGHGSNKRGTHSAGVDQVGNIQLHKSVLSTISKNPNGFSIRPESGKLPKSGFMVSIPGHSKILRASDLVGDRGAKIVQQYAREHSGVLHDARAHIGGWTDEATGKTHLDVSHNIKGMRAAVAAGRANNQIAIWDVKRGRQIDTGGTGD